MIRVDYSKILGYAFPIWKFISFSIVALRHIKLLRQLNYYVRFYDCDKIYSYNPSRKVKILFIHPAFYALFRYITFIDKAVNKLRQWSDVLIGVDVADSDRISKKAVEIANLHDYFIVNSQWSKEAFISSGVKTNIYEIPHFLTNEWINAIKNIESYVKTDPFWSSLLELKKQKNYIFVYYQLLHSGWRKGADLVYEVLKEVQEMYPNVILILKRSHILDPYLGKLRELKHFEIPSTLNIYDLVASYYVSDIVLLFSRGGSFEIVGLEALSVGRILLCPEKGAWTEYVPNEVRKYSFVRIAKEVIPMPNNPIHVGKGYEIDVNNAVEKLCFIIEHLNELKELYDSVKHKVINKYNEDNARKLFSELLERIKS